MTTPSLLQRLFAWTVAPVEHVALQIPRAIVASVAAAALDTGLFIVLVKVGGWPPRLAAVATYLIGGVLQYVLCSCWVFPVGPRNAATGFVAFTLLSLVGLGITYAVIWLACDVWHYDPVLAKLGALGLSFCWNFTSRKYLIFRATRAMNPSTRGEAVPQSPAPESQP